MKIFLSYFQYAYYVLDVLEMNISVNYQNNRLKCKFSDVWKDSTNKTIFKKENAMAGNVVYD